MHDYLEYFTYRIVERGDLRERLLILLLGVITLGCPGRFVIAERCFLDLYELSSEELIYPDELLYDIDIPESEFVIPLLSRPFSFIRWVHSSPQPRALDRCAIGSSGVRGR